MAIYKIPLPVYHQSRDIDRFILRFGHGKLADYKVVKLDENQWDFSNLPMTLSLDDARLAPMIGTSYDSSYDANDAPIVTVETNISDICISIQNICIRIFYFFHFPLCV